LPVAVVGILLINLTAGIGVLGRGKVKPVVPGFINLGIEVAIVPAELVVVDHIPGYLKKK
ncbi:MAG TPA: hypothetical protein DEP87_01380, partial [Candidatus Pacebacteria bacterium]|nr:hypothetical protein [Candidatus Paceibacterota bacterium]